MSPLPSPLPAEAPPDDYPAKCRRAALVVADRLGHDCGDVLDALGLLPVRPRRRPVTIAAGTLTRILALLDADPGEDWTAAELGDRLGMSRPKASRVLSDLYAHGRVDRLPATRGGRGAGGYRYRAAS